MNNISFMKFIMKISFFITGAVSYAFGLQCFILPNKLMDNGVNGIAVMIYYLSHYPLGILFIIMSLPFWIIGYQKISRNYVFCTIFSIVSLSIITELFKYYKLQPVTKDPLLAAIFGGVFLGIGVGMIIRNGGSFDGVETLSIIINKKIGFSVGEIALFFNLFIIGTAGVIFGIDRAMYSLISYFVSVKVIDMILEGFDEAKSVFIISEKPKQVSEMLITQMKKGVTIIRGKGGYSGEEKEIIYTVITRFEIGSIKDMVRNIDPTAFITINEVHEVMGGRIKSTK